MDAVYFLLKIFLVLCLVGLSQENALKHQHNEIKEKSKQQRASNVRGHRGTITYSLFGDGIDEHLPRKTIESVRISPLRLRTAELHMRSAKKDTLRERLNDTPVTGSKHLGNTREQPKPDIVPKKIKSKQNAKSKSSIRKSNRHTNATREESISHRRIESLQKKLLSAKSQSDSQPLVNLKTDACSSGYCERQLCPWSVVWNRNFNRSPIYIHEVSCDGQMCNINDNRMAIFRIFANRFQSITECATVTTDISVFINDNETTQTVRVACVCQYKRRPTTSTYQGDQSSLSFTSLSQTGKMTPIVKLDKMEDLDGIDPEILKHVLPLHHRHRNRKLREQDENESSSKQLKRG